MKATVTIRFRFAASHRLHTPVLSEEENQNLFGKCNNPYGHGHNYELRVSIRGEVDRTTGLVVRRSELKQYIRDRVLARIDCKNLNCDVAEFATLVPTTENLTLVIAQLLRENWAERFGKAELELVRVHVQETPRNSFEYVIGGPRPCADAGKERASVLA